MIIRRQRGAGKGDGQDGQGYLISVSDLMAGLLFVFIITLMVFALKLSGTEANLSSELDETYRKKQKLEGIVENLTDAKKIRSSLLNHTSPPTYEGSVDLTTNEIASAQTVVSFPFSSITQTSPLLIVPAVSALTMYSA